MLSPLAEVLLELTEQQFVRMAYARLGRTDPVLIELMERGVEFKFDLSR